MCALGFFTPTVCVRRAGHQSNNVSQGAIRRRLDAVVKPLEECESHVTTTGAAI